MTRGFSGAVVVGFDGSGDAESALRWASRLVTTTGSALVVVHAVGLLEHGGYAEPHAHEARVRAIASEEGVDPTRVAWRKEEGEPCEVLRRVAEEHDTSLVVVGTRGAGAHPGTVLGSTSLELAEHCRLPLAIVPVAAAAVSA